jgi:hypothetical protein
LSIVLAAIQWLQLARFYAQSRLVWHWLQLTQVSLYEALSLKNSTLQPRSYYDFVKIHHSTSSPLKPRGMATGQFFTGMALAVIV